MSRMSQRIQRQGAKAQGRKVASFPLPLASLRHCALALNSSSSSSPHQVSSTTVIRLYARGRAGLPILLGACLLLFASFAWAEDSAQLNDAYKSNIQPLLKTYCHECHSGDTLEADIDLAAFTDLIQIRKHTKVWQKIGEMLSSEQMPPPDSKQPTAPERVTLQAWVKRHLTIEAAAHAGDPGPVVLRRLSNAEYTYTLRDLTGIATLDPAQEFPVDSASGEGFTNVGNSLVMSPALLSKYLDAAKEVASHAVLLPDGMRFSPYNTRRDWTNESLAKIRGFYARYSGDGGGSAVNLQGIQFSTNTGGRLPVERYLLATIEERESLTSGGKTIEAVAEARGLSPKYLKTVWDMLTLTLSPSPEGREEPGGSLLLDPLRAKWTTATAADVPQLMELITPWQAALFKFNSVGQIGLQPDIKAWLVPVSPLIARQEFRVKLPTDASGEVVLSLKSEDAGDGNTGDDVLWERPRFVAPGRPDLLLKDVGRVADELARSRDRHFAQAAQCLAAASEAGQSTTAIELETLAKKHGVDADSLAAWLEYLGIGTGGPATIGTPITRKQEKAEAYDFIQGWVGDDALSVVANSSDQHVRVPGNVKPHSVVVHPAPTLSVAVGWRSPVAGALKISGLVQHAHPECGNGVAYSLELRRGNTRQRLASGESQRATVVPVGPFEAVAVRPGDVIALIISPKENNHSCDLTSIDLTLSDGTTEWNLWKEVSPDILAGNPHADSHGNKEVWHFFSEPTGGGGTSHVIPQGSVLAKWQATSDPAEKLRLGGEVQRVLQDDPAALAKDSPEAVLSQQLRSISGPFMGTVFSAVASQVAAPASASESKWGLPVGRFGKCPDGRATEPASLCIHAPDTLEIHLPAELIAGSEFVVSGFLHPETGRDGSVRLAVQTGPAAATLPTATPFITNDGSPARQRIETAFNDFRSLFPPTLCYTKIVPVDEVVTLLLYYREDDQLRRLMLTEEQSAQLDKMWDEHFYVAHEPLEMVTAFTQLYQFATQDRADMLPKFEPLRKPVKDNADVFLKRLIDNEPQQLAAVVAFAAKAYRRPLREDEVRELRSLYATLRAEELGHDEALHLTLAKVLISPAFLYHIETPGPGTKAAPLSDSELASRLSYFLWSTGPDEELLSLAAAGKLREADTLAAQAKRMLKDAKARRLATEFGAHWLHIHDFENHNEKSERHFPTFNALRGAMYEESLLVLTDLFQNDRSLLSLVDGDATFLNEELAKHYNIPGVTGPQWRRVEGVRQYSRGSILSLATTMSKQSGASRTSPILRGTWLSEVMLGEKLPKPPKNVPPLADTITEGLTERQMTMMHSSNPACAKCHLRVDPFGYALEGFDGIGRLRTKDAAGLPIETQTVLFDGTPIAGLEELKHYLGTTRRDAFVRQFTKKLLGYSLGRAVQLSDEPLLADIQKQLSQNDHRVGIAIEAIVRSPQFREIRGREMATEE